MDSILVSVHEPHEPELISFPVIGLYLFPRQPGHDDANNAVLWRQLRGLVHERCGGEIAMLACDGALLFYPNNNTPLLATLLTEPAFFDFLEEHDYDGRATKLFFHHSYRWSGLPWRPKTRLAKAEEHLLTAFNLALQQMGRFSDAPHPIPETEPGQRALYTTVPPMDWFLKTAERRPAPTEVFKTQHHIGY